MLFELLALDTGAEERQFMSKKIRYTDEPIEAKVIDDFLPSPAELAREEEKVKVTLNLSKTSVDFLKKEAKKQGMKYQTMIRNLVDYYVAGQ